MDSKLDRSNIEDIIPLTPMQEGMLFHYIMEPETLAYHEQISFGLVGKIKPDLMQKAWGFVTQKNEMLRAVYRWKNIDNPIQVILKNHQVAMSYYDLTKKEVEQKLAEIKQADFRNRIDIEQETLRVMLCKCGANDYTMIISNHHILYDGWSSGIMIKELINAYHALYKGSELNAPFKNKFSEYVKWIASRDKTEQKNYWKSYLAGAEQNDGLFSRVNQSVMKSYKCVLQQDLSDLIINFSKENGISTASLLYCAWGILAQKLNNTHDIIFGTTISGRNHPIKGIANMVGLFINTIPLRVQTDSEETIFQLLEKVNEATKNGHEFECTPLVDIQAYAGINNQSQLFNSLVVIENYPLNINDYQDEILAITHYSATPRTNYNLTLEITIQERISLNFQYLCFEDDNMIKRVGQYFETILTAIIFDKNSKVIDLDILSQKERNQLLFKFNDTNVAYPRDKTIYQLFEEQVEKTPENVALVFGEENLTYRELNEKTNQMARRLRESGVKPDHIVGLMVERTPAMIIGMLGIMKSGGAYMPIDPDHPEERVKFMLKDSESTILLTQSWLSDKVDFSGEKINLDDLKNYSINAENLELVNSSRDLAYVIYTSGTTGNPKGVLIEHRSIVNTLFWRKGFYQFNDRDVTLQIPTYTFDSSVADIFTPLISGSSLVLIEQDKRLDGGYLKETIITNKVTNFLITPTFYNSLLDSDLTGVETLRVITVAGESLHEDILRKHFELFKDVTVINEYGPTENSVCSTGYKINHKTDKILIGEPINNTRAYIVDDKNNLMPICVAGELCLSGNGLSRGYLHNDELTMKKFVKNPFEKNGVMYRTGDLARWLPDGNIEFLGRIDHQVKIRGFRIELEEIESQILKFDAVKETVVVAFRSERTTVGTNCSPAATVPVATHRGSYLLVPRKAPDVPSRSKKSKILERLSCRSTESIVSKCGLGGVRGQKEIEGDQYLCAYFVSEVEIPISELREHLSENLPNYMIPSHFIQLESIPLTPNGKLDRKALPEPEGKGSAEYVAPRNQTEEILAQIWSEVLGKEQIGVYDNFFELGGHSLKATVVISRIHKELNVELPLKELFSRPTISGISDYLWSAKERVYTAIKPAIEKEYYEASSAQKRMWLLWQFDHESTAYNMPGVLILDGILDKQRLEYTFGELIKRHESLRTTFDIVDGVIVQRVIKSVDFAIEYTESSSGYLEEAIKDFVRPFDLRKAPLLRVGLIKASTTQGEFAQRVTVGASGSMKSNDGGYGLAERECPEVRHYLLFDMHHIVSDGVSMSILTKEFMALYDRQELEEQRLQYKDFSEWQNEHLKSERIREQENYWLEQFSKGVNSRVAGTVGASRSMKSNDGGCGLAREADLRYEIPILNLPLDYPRPPVQSFAGGKVEWVLNIGLTKRLKSISKETGTTLYMILLSAITILLWKYTGQEDIIIGSPIAGRPHVDLECIIGMFVNTLAMRNYPKSSKTYAEFLKEVKETALAAYENQDYQFEELVDRLNLRRDLSRNPLFDVMFVLQNMEESELEIEGLRLMKYNSEQVQTKFDLTFTAIEATGEIMFNIEYCTSLFERVTIERLSTHLQNLIEIITLNKYILLGDIDILSNEEGRQLLYEFNDTYADYPRDKAIHQLFEEQVEKTPDNIALIFNKKRMSYSELNAKSNQLARLLREKDIKQDQLVGIMMERSLEMIVGLLGILKSGGAYLPIDPEYPEERIRFMIEDSQSEILLTQSWLSGEVGFDGEKINLDDIKLYTGRTDNLKQLTRANDLAYVIYTSGSTGKPKGVMVEHGNVVNLALGQKNRFNVNEHDHILQLSSISFDASVEQIFIALFSGASLYLIENETLLDPCKFNTFMKDNRITHLHGVPSFLNWADLRGLDHLKRIIGGGEEFSVKLAKKLNAQSALYNEYGPTETTITALMDLVNVEEGDSIISIGRPIANYQAYILSVANKPTPIGVVGELYIGGAGVARGYLNRPELTREKFVLNPFIKGERMYRTGDLARWQPDGKIEFSGRIDHQVKIRGFRIELGEIESQILKLDVVKETVVLAKEDERGDKYLCAYLVAEAEILVSEIREYLSAALPDYMIPSLFRQLEKMPLTASGKVDREALPEPDGKTESEYAAPRNLVEEILAQVWSEVLGKEKIGIYDNFFELGGHSLKGTILVSKIHQEFNVKLQLKEFFRIPTIAQLSSYIADLDENEYAAITVVEAKEYYETSYTQKRFWILNQLEPNSPMFNMPGQVTLLEAVDHTIIQKIFVKLFERHEAFRTRFKEQDGVILQIIEEKSDYLIETIDLSVLPQPEREQERIRIYEEVATKIFNLEAGQLAEVKLIKVHEQQYDLVFCLHHIIADGGSLDVLKKEFLMMYDAYKQGKEWEAVPLRLQYKDFASWQNRLIEDKQFSEGAKAFWMRQLSGATALSLPTDYRQGETDDKAGSGYQCFLAADVKDRLKELALEYHTSLFSVLITTFITFLGELTKQEDILIGVPTFGRGHEELQSVIGCFINTTILRNQVNREASFVEILKKINQNTLEALHYQDYPLELAVEELQIKYPQITTCFNMLNFGESEQDDMNDLNFEHIAKTQDVKFDLECYVTEYRNAIQMVCVYNARLFKPKTIEYIMSKYLDYVIKVSKNPHKLLKDYFTNEKRRRLE